MPRQRRTYTRRSNPYYPPLVSGNAWSKYAPGYVYLFRLASGVHKIGFAHNPHQRAKYYPATLVHAVPVPNKLRGEQVAHHRFSHRALGRERFNLSAHDVRTFKRLTTADLTPEEMKRKAVAK